MRLNLPIFDQDRTLGASTTQSVGRRKQLATGALKFELSPYITKPHELNKWMARCIDQLQKSQSNKYRIVKDSIMNHLSNQTAMSEMVYFYEEPTASLQVNQQYPGRVHWRMRSPSESQVFFPVSCYHDTYRMLYHQCALPKNVSSWQHAASIVLKQAGGDW